MAFTDEEKLYIFEVFDVASAEAGFELWGVLGEANTVQQFQWTGPKVALDTAIANLEAAADAAAREGIVKGLLTEWVKARLDVLELRSAEDVTGVVTSPSRKRDLIKQRLLTYLPVYREGEAELRHGSGVGAAAVMRG